MKHQKLLSGLENHLLMATISVSCSSLLLTDLMADKNDLPIEEEERNPGYKPPSPKSLKEIRDLDTDDESLHKYKQMLLGIPDTSGVYPK